MLHVAHQVDEDVDAVAGDAARGRGERLVPRVDEPVERAGQPPAVIAAVAPAERIAEDLEPPAVVPLEQAGGKVRRGVIAEVGGHVADAEPPAAQPPGLRRGPAGAAGVAMRAAK